MNRTTVPDWKWNWPIMIFIIVFFYITSMFLDTKPFQPNNSLSKCKLYLLPTVMFF